MYVGTNNKDVLALYYCSPIYALVEALLHNENHSLAAIKSNKYSFQPRTGGAQVAFRFSQARQSGSSIHAKIGTVHIYNSNSIITILVSITITIYQIIKNITTITILVSTYVCIYINHLTIYLSISIQLINQHITNNQGGRSWHIDGMDRGTYGAFSLLIGVALSDQLVDYCGNLCLHAG